jgi:hypothetical protein
VSPDLTDPSAPRGQLAEGVDEAKTTLVIILPTALNRAWIRTEGGERTPPSLNSTVESPAYWRGVQVVMSIPGPATVPGITPDGV